MIKDLQPVNIKCAFCGKSPYQIDEYKNNPAGIDPEEYLINQEQTYNPITKRFACTNCCKKNGWDYRDKVDLKISNLIIQLELKIRPILLGLQHQPGEFKGIDKNGKVIYEF